MEGNTTTTIDTDSKGKEWDETTCPICMDHPHNAVLLICSSHERGCRSFICDSSYRHSNCLDRFRKLKELNKDNPSQPSSSFHETFISERLAQEVPRSHDPEPFERGLTVGRNLVEPVEESSTSQEPDSISVAQVDERISPEEMGERKTSEMNYLKCPLCRGAVLSWMIVKEAREYLDLKPRSCAWESCPFSGNYGDLRRHARRAHPAIRPADVDPVRQRAWRHLERQQEHGDIISAIRSAMPGSVVLGDYAMDSASIRLEGQQGHGDILSAIRTAMPGAVVLGDYVMDNGDVPPRDREANDGNGPSWNTFFLFHVIRNPRVRTWRSHRNRNLWGENLLGLQDDDDDDDDDDWELDDDIPITRTHQRFTRSRLLDADADDDDWEDVDGDISLPRRRRRFTSSRPDDEQP